MKKKVIIGLVSMMFFATVSFSQTEPKEKKEQKEQKEITVKECVEKKMNERSIGEKVVDRMINGSKINREATLKTVCQFEKLQNEN